jgi:hypothetical protein
MAMNQRSTRHLLMKTSAASDPGSKAKKARNLRPTRPRLVLVQCRLCVLLPDRWHQETAPNPTGWSV